ncbi:MAG: D-2-hydroxyacid dehydrogenase [Cytophagaceae bacterium]|nr:D-2-hydroxyacid dehydrogenase [Cytophagaceae bacterium]
MKIVFLDAATMGPMPELDKLRSLGNVTFYDHTMPLQVLDRVQGASVIITNKVVLSAEMLKQLPTLKLICVAATGMNNIDLSAAADLNIQVKNVKGYSTASVVQLTFGVLLELLYNLPYYHSYVQSGEYSNQPLFTHIGPDLIELEGKTMGIIGMGAIGRGVAKVAEAFGMKILYYSSSGKNTNAGYPMVSLNDLAQLSDVVSIHAPLNEQTKGLINSTFFKCMKSSAVLINMGRGGIVVEEDLINALESKIVYGAALDVFEQEPLKKGHPLIEASKVYRLLLTPHIAWAGYPARVRLIEGIIHNIKESKITS